MLAGVATIVVLNAHRVRGPLGGLAAAGVTGIVIFVVSHVVDGVGRGPRAR